MADEKPCLQLDMIWPPGAPEPAPFYPAAPYRLRPFVADDAGDFLAVIRGTDLGDWDRAYYEGVARRVVPGTWFVAEHEPSGTMVATAMGLHDSTERHPGGSELAWVGCLAEHRGHRLGYAVCSAVTAALLVHGYHDVHLYTDDFRLPAIVSYLRLGFLPYLFAPDMLERWRAVCEATGQPFTPERWPTSLPCPPQP